jgi:hypothetical protein
MSLPAKQPSRIAPRVVALFISFALVVIIGPPVIRLRFGDMTGSTLPFLVVPGLFVVLWLLFSAFVIGALLMRDGSTISPFTCIGIGFLFAVAATILISFRIPTSGPYGPGP